MSAFKVGQVVELNSGGPKMTVTFVIGDPNCPPALAQVARAQGYTNGSVSCVWFDGTTKEKGMFQAETVKLSTTDSA